MPWRVLPVVRPPPPRLPPQHRPRRVEARHRIGHPRRNGNATRAIHGSERRVPQAARRDADRLGGARGRGDRRLSGIHGDDRPRDPRGSRAAIRRGDPQCPRVPRHRDDPAARVQQHLCDRDARGRRQSARHKDHFRPAVTPGRAAVVQQRVPQPHRRLARPARPVRAAAAAGRGDGARAGLSRAPGRGDRRDGPVLDRRRDRQVRPAGAAGRPAPLPGVRRRLPLSRRPGPAGAAAWSRRCGGWRDGSPRRRWCAERAHQDRPDAQRPRGRRFPQGEARIDRGGRHELRCPGRPGPHDRAPAAGERLAAGGGARRFAAGGRGGQGAPDRAAWCCGWSRSSTRSRRWRCSCS